MWRPRDRERFIGSYDPEHEMPDPDRSSGDRWQSDAYRNHFRDSRYAYRMNPDRFEERFEARRDVDREMEMRWNRDGRDVDRGGYGAERYARQWDRDWDRERAWHGDRDRGMPSGPRWDRDRLYGSDRGFDTPRGRSPYEPRPFDDRDRGYPERPRYDRWEREDEWRRRR